MTTIIECPLAACDWMLDATPPQVSANALASVFGPGTFAATSAYGHATDTERKLRDHFTTHPLEEWVAEITRLREENGELRRQQEGRSS